MSLAVFGLAGRILLLGIERIVVKRLGEGADAFSAAFLFFWIGGVLLLPFVGLDVQAGALSDLSFAPWTLVTGAIYAVAFTCYVKSLSEGEASLVSPLYNFNIFFLALMAWFFLGEPLSAFKFAGLCLLVYGSSFLVRRESVLKALGALLEDRACRFMMLASFLIAVGRIIDKTLMTSAPPITYSCLLYWVISAYLLLYVNLRGRGREPWRLLRARPWDALAGGAINGYSYLFLLFAMTGIDVSVAEPASMLGLVVTMFLSKWLLHETIGRRLVGAGVMIVGSWLLFL